MGLSNQLVIADSFVALTERERQTLKLISDGYSNKVIARNLGITEATVKVHVRNLLSKLNLHSRLELAAWAYKATLDHSPAPTNLYNLMNGTPVMIYRCLSNRRWDLRYASAGARLLTGYDVDDLNDFPGAYLVYENERARAWDSISRCLAVKSSFDIEYSLVCADGSVRPVRDVGCGIYSTGGEILGMEGVITAWWTPDADRHIN